MEQNYDFMQFRLTMDEDVSLPKNINSDFGPNFTADLDHAELLHMFIQKIHSQELYYFYC